MPCNYAEYHPKWSLISRLIRFKRADNHCEWCQAENYQPHPITGSKVVLTVAHIDQDKNNNRFNNLAALCQRCHLRHDLGQHIMNRKYGRNWKKHQLALPFPNPADLELPVWCKITDSEASPMVIPMEYFYKGDRMARTGYFVGLPCAAVRRLDGKCIRGRNGNMLVQFENGTTVVLPGRQLRKIKPLSGN